MQSIKRMWEMYSLEVNGTVMIVGYIATAVLLYLTYIQVL